MSKYTNAISAFRFMRMFPNEQAAIAHLEKLRWRGKPICPYCKERGKATLRKGRAGVYSCKNCRKDFTVRIGTIFERSHIPMHKWMYGIYLLQTARKNVSSLQLSKELGVTQKSAWFMLHRLREACHIKAIKLTGIVEVDETYIEEKEGNRHRGKKQNKGRGATGKQAVIGMRERKGRMKAMPIEKADASTLKRGINRHVRAGSTLCTDDHRGYMGLGGQMYRHERVRHSAKEFVNGMAHTNGIESVWAVLKRGYNGVYHNWSAKHCRRYVDEFSFRLNEGNCSRHSLERLDSLLCKTVGKRITYKELVQ